MPALPRKQRVLDSRRVERFLSGGRSAQTIDLVPHFLAHRDRRDSLLLLFPAAWRRWADGARRAAVCVDRARHDGERRLDHAAAIRFAVVRKAAAVLLGRGAQLQIFRSERNVGAIAERDRGTARDSSAGVAGVARLRERDGSVAAITPSVERGHGRFFALCGDRHAVQRNAYVRDGSSGGAVWAGPTRERRSRIKRRSEPKFRERSFEKHILRRGGIVRAFSRLRDAGKRSGGDHSLRRRSRLLGGLHETMERHAAIATPNRHRSLLRRRTAVVRAVRRAQSGFSARLHPRTQLQTLSNTGISAHSTVLVLRG